MKKLEDLDVAGKRVFVRADLDIPMEQLTVHSSQSTENATRLTNLKPTVDWLLGHRAKQIVIAGHIDRPEGPDPKLSTAQLEKPLEEILKRSITFRAGFDERDHESLASLSQLILFENLRFWSGEASNDQEFAKQLASLGDVYVNEAFGNSHREHASMVALPGFLPHAAGLHLEKEIEVLSRLLKTPERPFVAIVGGAKLETKVPVIENLASEADSVLVGGAIALQILNSKFEIRNENPKVKIATMTEDTKDIDKESIEKFSSVISNAKTVVWNGPMGLFEEGFDAGTKAVAQAIIDSGAYSVVGGGETTEFLASFNFLKRFSFVSSGGGAMLEFLSGKELPGIKALE